MWNMFKVVKLSLKWKKSCFLEVKIISFEAIVLYVNRFVDTENVWIYLHDLFWKYTYFLTCDMITNAQNNCKVKSKYL